MKFFTPLITLYFCFFMTKSCFSQDNGSIIEVIYVKAYKNYKDTINSIPRILKNIEYKLTCNMNEAKFEYINFMDNDGEKVNRRFLAKGGGKGVYYKNLNEKLKIHQIQSPMDGKKYLIKMPFNEYAWIITKETKEISGYLCYKAYTEYELEIPDYNGKLTKTKNKIVVWFTPEINYSFGPAGFDGLPGLVLEKYSNSFYFIASKIIFNVSDKSPSIVKPEVGIEITNENYQELLMKHINELD